MAEEALGVRWEPGPVAVVHAPGQLDMATAGAVTRLLEAVLAREPVVLVVDMTGTGFCDSAAAAVLIRASRKAARAGVSLRVAVASPAVRQTFRLLRLGQVVDVYPGLAAALHEATPRQGGHGKPPVPWIRPRSAARSGAGMTCRNSCSAARLRPGCQYSGCGRRRVPQGARRRAGGG